MELLTDRLILRGFRTSDFKAVHKYASDNENLKYMIWGPNTKEETRTFLFECVQSEYLLPRKRYDFAVVIKDNKKLIGGCGIYLSETLNVGELGWILNKDYWKLGYGSELARALIAYSFEELKLHRVYATCNAENYGSYRVMERCGMRREGEFIKSRYGRVGNEEKWYDEYLYAILQDEWTS